MKRAGDYILTQDYQCIMSISNSEGRDDFESIAGDHIEGFNDNSVTVVRIVTQNTANVPQIICEKFPNILSLFVIDSNLSTLSELSFSSCANLAELELDMNHLEIIADVIFLNNQQLHSLSVANNRITEITANAFMGVPIRNLDIRGNSITSLSRETFAPLANTLVNLWAINSHIEVIEQGTFVNFINLIMLDLSRNQITAINSNTFSSMFSLTTLFLDHNQIQSIDERIFNQMPNLFTLDLTENQCANQDFFNVPEVRDEMMLALRECFDVFLSETISCTFEATACNLNIYNPGKNRKNFSMD